MVQTPSSISRSSASSGVSSSAGPASSARKMKASGSICAIRVQGQYFGLDVQIVGEYVQASRILSIPLAPPAVLGLFSLRGSPTVLVSLAALIGLARPATSARGATISAVVLRAGEVSGALAVDSVEGIFALSQGKVRTPAEGEDGGLGEGFFEPLLRPELGVRLLRSEEDILAPLARLKFAPRRAAPTIENT